MSRRKIIFPGLVFVCCATVIGGTGFAANAKTKLSMQQAREIANRKESGKIKSGELEKEHGRWIYSFDIQGANQIHEVNVDANTGKVIEDSVEDPAAEARENAQEAKHNTPNSKR